MRRVAPAQRLRHARPVGALGSILLLLALNGAVLAALLMAAPGNRLASRVLAALIGLISLRLVIYVLGFAGLYDAHPWLTFAPLDASLAFGPLLWLYIAALTERRLPQRWPLHLAPAALQLGYSSVAFALPLALKLRWYGGPHLAVVEPAGFAALLASASAYLALAWRRRRAYQRWLDGRFADCERWRLGWMTMILAAFAATLGVAVAAALFGALVTPLDYFGRTPVVIASSLLAYALGLIGWRHAARDLPAEPASTKAEDPPRRPGRAGAAFAGWEQRIAAAGWWREEGLTLTEVASRLGVSDRTLSRGLNEGGGRNFNAFINGLRVEAVMRAIAGGARGDLLAIALDCGFNSKASFNRAFLRHTGVTPSRWRADRSQMPPIAPVGAM